MINFRISLHHTPKHSICPPTSYTMQK